MSVNYFRCCALSTFKLFPKTPSSKFVLNSRNRLLSSQPNSSSLPKNNVPLPKNTEGNNIVAKESLFQRFKSMYRDYWYVLVPVHVVTSLGWIGGFYYFLSSGVDLGYYMKKIGISEAVVDKITKSGAGNLAIAYALYKIATPARYTVTLGGTTLAINSLRNLGYIKPAKEIYTANKEKLQKQIQKSRELKKMKK